jgi:hypothetical protein
MKYLNWELFDEIQAKRYEEDYAEYISGSNPDGRKDLAETIHSKNKPAETFFVDSIRTTTITPNIPFRGHSNDSGKFPSGRSRFHASTTKPRSQTTKRAGL